MPPDLERRLLANLAAVLANAGYVIVPREPTAEMMQAGVDAVGYVDINQVPLWRAMVAAAGK